MGTICVLKTAHVAPGGSERDRGRCSTRPVSLLAFLQAENIRLQNAVAQLQSDTTALREALQER